MTAALLSDLATAVYVLAALALGWGVTRLLKLISHAYKVPPGAAGFDADTLPDGWHLPTVPLPCTGPCQGRVLHELAGDGTATCLRCGTTTHTTEETP